MQLENIIGDARALVVQGEQRDRVRVFLMARRVAENDALALVEELFRERIDFVRSTGVKRCKQGGALILVPVTYQVAAYFGGFWHGSLFILLSIVGMVGIFRVGNALPLARRPESFVGDLTLLM